MVARQSPNWGDRFADVLVATDYDAETALGLMGDGIAGQLRESIIETDSPANSPVTNLLKQRFPTRDGMEFSDVLQARADVAAGEAAPPGKPLSWSGHMLASVDREVK
nr:MAG TPA_asm: virion morphogenesis protein [Caudoviricetes sp.]